MKLVQFYLFLSIHDAEVFLNLQRTLKMGRDIEETQREGVWTDMERWGYCSAGWCDWWRGEKGGGFGGGERAVVQSRKKMRAQRQVVYNTSYMETVHYSLFSVIRVT